MMKCRPLLRAALGIAAGFVAMQSAGCGGSRGDRSQSVDRRANRNRLVVCWQVGTPATVLRSLAPAHEKQADVEVHVVEIPRREFYPAVSGEFGPSGGTAFDVVIGKSHWLAERVHKGQYVDLSYLLKRDIGITDVCPSVREWTCEYPKESGTYHAAPCHADPLGLVFRRDWLEEASGQTTFQAKYGRALVAPRTWAELKDAAEFLHRPTASRFGLVMPTSRDGNLLQSFQQIFYAYGGQYGNATNYEVNGFVNSPLARDAVERLKALIRLGPENAAEATLDDVVTCFIRGRAAFAFAPFSTFDGIATAMGDKAGFAPSPAGPDGRRAPFVEGFGMSVSSRIPPERQERAIQFVRWFLSPATQSNWTERTSLSFSAARLKDPKYLATRPYLEAYAETLQCMRGFWSVQPAEALVAQLEKHIGDAVDGYVDTAKALDRLVLDWESTLRQAGLLSQY